MNYIGIDPGVTGAIAIFNDERNWVKFFDTPVFETASGRMRCDPHTAAKVIREFQSEWVKEEAIWVLEEVHPMPGIGSIGGFSIGCSYGIWLGLLAARKIQVRLITPERWKKALGLNMPKVKQSVRKEAGRQKALELFPCATAELSRKKDHGRADALLLAEWGSKYGGKS